MDADENSLELLTNAKVLVDETGYALHRQNSTKYASDEVQAAIIQKLGLGRCEIEDLDATIRESSHGTLREDEISLALAQFILDFGAFLKD